MNILLNIQFMVASLLVGWINAEPLNTEDTQTPTYTPEQCGAFMGLQFAVYNYDKYDTYFDDSSMITLAQAGVYVGPSNIQEYVGFTDTVSPYFAATKIHDNQVELTGFDPATGVCKFSFYSVSGVDFDPNMTNGDTLNYGVIVNIYYSISSNKVEQAHVFYTPEAIEAVFTRFRTDRVDDFICDTLLSSSCLDALGDSAEEGLTKQECQRRLAKLPLAEGDENYFDSNSHSCRAMHATFARKNPTHCAHIAFVPTEDPNGKIKCQESAGVSPSEFFSQEEIDRLLGICANSPEVDDTCFRAILNPTPTKPPKTDAPTSGPTGNPTRSPTPASTGPSSTKNEKKGKKGKKGKSDKKAKRGKKSKG